MKILLLQLPIPQYNYGLKTGNIPLGAACLKVAVSHLTDIHTQILPESITSYLGDAALLDLILSQKADIIGFTVFNWNIERSLYFSQQIKKQQEVKIIFGGPEITRDNPLLNSDLIDFCVYGEGEAILAQLVLNPGLWEKRKASLDAESVFLNSRSPYLYNLLEPEIEEMMGIETQRGCPYRCAYCYYNKSRRHLSAVSPELVLEGIQWAYDRRISEVFLLDPSLSTRPDLKELLKKIAAVNKNRQISFLSEIRAESIDESLAELFADAGFTEFETGLQTVNPQALKLMNRPTDLKRFQQGVKHLQKAGIRAKVDLIIGLPGDSLTGFKESVNFVASRDMHKEIQVFFLSVLPGTEFRRKSGQLGLHHDSRPPYTVFHVPGFSQEDMLSAFLYAEDAFEINLRPQPDLDLSYLTDRTYTTRHESSPVSKIIVQRQIPLSRIETTARHAAHPFQTVFMQSVKNENFMTKTIEIFCQINPFTPFETVFMEPETLPNIEAFEDAAKSHRLHYPDSGLVPYGNRPVRFILVSSDEKFAGCDSTGMLRVFRWTENRVPDAKDLEFLSSADGILMDNKLSRSQWEKWQDEFAPHSDTILPVSFADISLQYRWMQFVSPESRWSALRHNILFF